MINRTPAALKYMFSSIVWDSPTGDLLFTFDDGPDAVWTPKFSELLNRHNKKGIFFIVGNRVKDNSVLSNVISAGHAIGWHSQTHRAFWRLSKNERAEELTARKAVEDKLGEKMEFFRFPYGRFLPWHIGEVLAEGLTPMLWSYMISDYKNTPADTLFHRLQKTRQSDCLLLHDRGQNAAQTFAALTRFLQNPADNH